jgi:hypothetical protein
MKMINEVFSERAEGETNEVVDWKAANGEGVDSWLEKG